MKPAPAVLLRQMRAPDKRNGKGRAIPEAYCLAFLQLTRAMSLSPCLEEKTHERKIMEILQKTKPWRQVVKVGVLYAAGAGGMDLLASDGTTILFRGREVRESLAESNRDYNTGVGLDS